MKVVNIDDYRRALDESKGILLSIFDPEVTKNKPDRTVRFPQLINLHYAMDVANAEVGIASLGLQEKDGYIVVPTLLDCLVTESVTKESGSDRFVYRLRRLFYPNINEGLEELGIEPLQSKHVVRVISGPPVFITFSREEVLKTRPPRF